MLSSSGFFVPAMSFQQDMAELLGLFASCAKPADIIAHLKRCNKRNENLAMRMVAMPREEWFASIDLPGILRGYVQQGYPIKDLLAFLEMTSAIRSNLLHVVCSRSDVNDFINWMYLLLDMLDRAGASADKVAGRIYDLLNAESGYYGSDAIYKPFAAINTSMGTYSWYRDAYFEVVFELGCHGVGRGQLENLLMSGDKSIRSDFIQFIKEKSPVEQQRFPLIPKPVFFKEPPTAVDVKANNLIAAIIWPFSMI